MAKKDSGVLEFPVNFGNVSVGDETTRITISLSRANVTITQADKHFCCKRLTCKLVAGQNGDAAGQPSLPGVPDPELTGVADCKRFSAGGKNITAGLTFVLTTVDLNSLAHMAKKAGKLIIEGVEELPEEAADRDDEE